MMRAESGLGAIGGRAKPPALGWVGSCCLTSSALISLSFLILQQLLHLLQLELQTAQLLVCDNILYIPTQILEERMRST
jgi:hypothetical protein